MDSKRLRNFTCEVTQFFWSLGGERNEFSLGYYF